MANGGKILVAEDGEFLLKIYETKLRKEGYDLVVAKDGEQALVVAKAEKPSLILLDLIMPKKTGFEVLDELKADSELKDTPVIVLSNLGQDEDVKKAMDKGANDYVIKANSSVEEIVKKVATYLN